MTTAGVHRSAPVAGRRPARPALAVLRLPWLYLVSRRVPAALGLIAALGVLLWASLHWHWNVAGGPAAQEFISLAIETGAAAVVAVTTYGPFGEPERAAGRWLPYLRLGAALALTAAAFGALAAAAAAGATGGTAGAAGAAAGGLAGGTLAMLRNLAGIVGTGLLTAAAAGGAFGWVGPMAYLLVTEVALAGTTTTPWVWPAHPAHDRGAAICASLVYAAGVAVITVRGARNSGRDPAPE